MQIGDEIGAVETLERLASIAIHDEPEGAARLFGAATAQRERLGAPLPSWQRSNQDETAQLGRSVLGEARYEANARRGSELSLEEAATSAVSAA